MIIRNPLYAWLRICALACIMCVGALDPRAALAQTTIFTEVKTLVGGAQPVDAIEKTLTIQTAGQYDLILTDLKQPAALAAVRLAVMSGSTIVTTAAEAGTYHFDATPGTYTVRVVGALDAGKASGTVGVQIKSSDTGQVALEFVSPLQVQAGAIPPELHVLETDIAIAAAGDYEVTLTDLQLPAALSQLRLALTPVGGSIAVTLDTPGVATFTAQAGTYHLVAIGEAEAGGGGLFSVQIRSVATGAVTYRAVEPVAKAQRIGEATLGAGARTLTLADFAFPLALTQSAVVIERDGQAIARLASPGSTSFTSPGCTCTLYAFALPQSPPGVGSYGIEVRPPAGAAEFATVQTVSAATGTTPAYTFAIDVPAAGSYQLALADFQFPSAFQGLSIAVVQDGALAGAASSAGTLNVTLAAGKVSVIVVAQPQAGAAALFGLSMGSSGGGAAPLFETTQGVGRAFSARTISIATAGTYTVSLLDLGFPVDFVDLAAVVTRGADRFGSIVNGGQFSFTAASAGDYIISLLAGPGPIQAGSQQSAGTYALSVATPPPAPSVTLTASATSVVKGQGVTLTWSSQNATSCVASGDWAGSRALSGSESIASLQAPATYKIECSNAEGVKANASVSVDVTAAQKTGGGGGSLDALVLALLLIVALARAAYGLARGDAR
ncbi:MAG TPA: hypothetical protein VG994_09455 [Steroidobacteraceae bacterium]|nr:hypothetical protein [Steroidobacteraceae bacterium]